MRATGHCLCGAIRFEVNGAPSPICLCHCAQCRRAVGATPVAWATYDREGFRILAGEPRWFQSSPAARRGFCADCGCSLFFESSRTPDEIDVTVVTLDNAPALSPRMHIFAPSKLSWEKLDDGLPRHIEDSSSPLLD
ncbi:MAG TPA: GFA family protein [Polyangiaceae bacterium]|nr:GFA family protein [Polyangiaceae bacterium]